jgi:hypothetical protein
MVRIAGCEHGKRIAGLREKLAAEIASWVCGVNGDMRAGGGGSGLGTGSSCGVDEAMMHIEDGSTG